MKSTQSSRRCVCADERTIRREDGQRSAGQPRIAQALLGPNRLVAADEHRVVSPGSLRKYEVLLEVCEVMEIRKSCSVETVWPRLAKEPAEDLPLLESRNPEMSELLADRRRGPRRRRNCTAYGRKRYGAGRSRNTDSSMGPSARAAVRSSQLHDCGGPGTGERALRSRAGPLPAQWTIARPLRGGSGRDGVFRRDRRAHTCSPGTISSLRPGTQFRTGRRRSAIGVDVRTMQPRAATWNTKSRRDAFARTSTIGST